MSAPPSTSYEVAWACEPAVSGAASSRRPRPSEMTSAPRAGLYPVPLAVSPESEMRSDPYTAS